MKKYFSLFIICIICSTVAPGQTPQLWGTNSIGGSAFIGNIFRINGDGTGYEQMYPFASGSPQSSLLPAGSSIIYGVTVSGGNKFLGEIYSYNSTTGVFTSLHSLDSLKGFYPRGNLCMATDNKLYGLTSNGGTYDFGVLFGFDPASNSYTKLHEFDNTTGKYPNGGVVQSDNGKLYGMTTSGGSSSAGVIFSFDITSLAFSVVHEFAFTDGFAPFGSLLNGNDGLLYGMAFGGGTSGNGAIFKFNPSNNDYQVIHNFSGTDGAAPWATLIQSANGTLYGTTSQGGSSNKGVLFRMDPTGSNFSILHDFEDATGSSPWNGVMMASDGNLYGMTTFGGANAFGAIYSYSISSDTYTKLHDCDIAGGGFPYGDFVEYYSTTGVDGLNTAATVSIYPNPATEEFSITLSPDISLPLTMRISDVNGNVIKEATLTRELNYMHPELATGNYLITLINKNQAITKKLVIE